MELLTPAIKAHLGNSSWIRRMFEAGIELKKKYGAENVYDFSLGNPDLPPPAEVKNAMLSIAAKSDQPFAFLLRPQGLKPTRLLYPWDFPGKNTGMGCHFLIQRIFSTQGWSLWLPHCWWILYCWATRVTAVGI